MVIAAALTSDLHWEQMDMFRRHVLRRRGRGTAAGSRRSRPGVVLCSWQDQATRGGRGDDPGAGWGSGPFSGKRVPAAACTEAVSGAHQLLTWGKQEAAAAEANQLARQLDLHTFALRSIRGLLLSLTHRACPLARETDRGPPLGRRRNLGSRQFLMYVHIWCLVTLRGRGIRCCTPMCDVRATWSILLQVVGISHHALLLVYYTRTS